MTDSDIDSHVEKFIRIFDEGINGLGFRTIACGDAPSEWRWRGSVGPDREPAVISLTSLFPYEPPEVVLPERRHHGGWHRGINGVLCLWDRHSQGDLPWLQARQLLDRVGEWIENDDNGWTGDAPALDLEAYHRPRLFRRGGQMVWPMLVVEDWLALAGYWFRATQPNDYGRINVLSRRHLAPQVFAEAKSRRRKRRRGPRQLDGIAIDLGEMTTPMVSTADLRGALGAHWTVAATVLAARRPVLVACRYTRLGAVGLIGFWMTSSGTALTCEFFEVAEWSNSQRRRAGWHAATIAERTLSVVGVGSVGSYVADMLHRSGVRYVHLHDSDLLKPGNLVRHAASARYVGAPKTEAVRQLAVERDPTAQILQAGHIRGLEDAVGLLRRRDLVIDCTGDRLTWQLFRTAASITGRRFLHVAVEGHGQYARVDVCPPFDAAAELPHDDVQSISLTEREGGCGDPISPTPPVASLETAAIGARLAIRILAGERIPAAGERRELFPVVP